MNRGSPGDTEAADEVIIRASMRPRFMNRGSPRGNHARAERVGCFNEAPIHESGK